MTVLDQAYRKESSTAFSILIPASLSAFGLFIHMVENLGASKLWLILVLLIRRLQTRLVSNLGLANSFIGDSSKKASDSGLNKQNQLRFCFLLGLGGGSSFWLLKRRILWLFRAHNDCRLELRNCLLFDAVFICLFSLAIILFRIFERVKPWVDGFLCVLCHLPWSFNFLFYRSALCNRWLSSLIFWSSCSQICIDNWL